MASASIVQKSTNAYEIVIEDAVAGERDLPGLKVTNLMIKDLTQVSVKKIRSLA